MKLKNLGNNMCKFVPANLCFSFYDKLYLEGQCNGKKYRMTLYKYSRKIITRYFNPLSFSRVAMYCSSRLKACVRVWNLSVLPATLSS